MLRRKSEWPLMKLIDKIPFIIPKNFMTGFWTTIGGTIGVPTCYDDDPDWGSAAWKARHALVLVHEATHVEQFKTYGRWLFSVGYLGPAVFPGLLLWLISLLAVPLIGWLPVVELSIVIVLLLPLSTGLAFGRWVFERTAYLAQIHSSADIEWAVESLWANYAFTWPRAWMRSWFLKAWHDRCNRKST